MIYKQPISKFHAYFFQCLIIAIFVIGSLIGSIVLVRIFEPANAGEPIAEVMVQQELPDIQISVYPAVVERVIDGDTYDLSILIFNDLMLRKRIRLIDADTPELRPRKGTDEEKALEKQRAIEATEAASNFMKGRQIFFKSAGKYDNFGRALGTVLILEDGEWLDVRDDLRQKHLLN